MDQFIEGKNPYKILELKNGQQSTLEEIKKVSMGRPLPLHGEQGSLLLLSQVVGVVPGHT